MPTYIPNSFQTPNIVVDRLAALLTAEETVVLLVVIRRILGFQDTIDALRARCSLAYISKKSGLSPQAIRTALDGLSEANIVLPQDSGHGRRGGREIVLNLGQAGDYNWDYLSARYIATRVTARRQTAAARAARHA